MRGVASVTGGPWAGDAWVALIRMVGDSAEGGSVPGGVD